MNPQDIIAFPEKFEGEFWSIDKIHAYDKNAKVHPPEQIEQLVKSIKRHKLVNIPQIAPDGQIITGHGRIQALIQMGLTEIPVIVRSDLSAVEIRELRIADNKTTSEKYDYALLKDDLSGLSELVSGDLELLTTGLSDREMSMMLADIGEMDMNVFSSDLDFSTEVVRESEKAEAAITSTDNEARVALAKAFGFKDVTVAQSRTLKRFMSAIEANTGKEGADALVAYLEKSLLETA